MRKRRKKYSLCHHQGVLGTIQPDQMQACNPLLILIMIPLFEQVIYPLAARVNLLIKYERLIEIEIHH